MSSVDNPSDEETDGPVIREPEHEIPIDEDFTGPFFQEIGRRKLDGRDAKVLVTADHAQTGVGKSNLCDFLGYVCDTTEEGFNTSKIAIDPPEFFDKYGQVEAGSAIVLEEGEQLDSRRSMSSENVDASHTWAKERVRELIAFINLPSPQMIDGRIELLADFWINVEIRGRATIYKKKINRIKGAVYYETMQGLEWPNMDGSQTFQMMERQKLEHLDDEESGDNWVRKSKVDEMLEKARKEADTQRRNDLLSSIYRETELTAKDIADCSAVGISGGRIRQIANESN